MTDLTHTPTDDALVKTLAMETPTPTTSAPRELALTIDSVEDPGRWVVETSPDAAKTRQESDAEAVALAMTLDSIEPETSCEGAMRPTATSQSHTTVLPRAVVGEGAEMKLTRDSRARYQPLSKLGQGGVGEVLLVHDNDIDRDVAMKRLKADLNDNTGAVLRFAEEVRAIGQLDHPNIIPIHDVGVDAEGHYFFIMKKAQGETLETIIDKLAEGDLAYHARFTMEVRVQIVMELLRALRFAHERGLIHRDIKPSNVMVGPYNEVTLMDWGLAKRLGEESAADDWQGAAGLDALEVGDALEVSGERSLRLIKTEHGAILGTPAYLAPEQATGDMDAIGVRSDIYSVCALFYELIALQHYLPGRNTLSQLILAVTRDTPEPPASVHNPHQDAIPRPLSNLIMKGLAKEPDARWGSVDEVMEELRLIQEGRIHVECAVTFAKRATRWMDKSIDRHPAMAFAMLATPIVLLLVSVGALAMLALQ